MNLDSYAETIRSKAQELLAEHGVVEARALVDAVANEFDRLGVQYSGMSAWDLEPYLPADMPRSGFRRGWLLP